MRRRRFLGATGAAGGAALAGCSNLPFGGGGADEFELRRWLYAPDEREDTGDRSLRFRYARPATIHERASDLPENYLSEYGGDPYWSTLVGVDVPAIENFLTLGGAFVAQGGFDEGTLERAMADNDLEHVRDHEGYAIHLTTDRTPPGSGDYYAWSFALDGSTLLGQPQWYEDPEEAFENLEFLVDTHEGTVDRLTEAVDAGEALLSTLPDGQERRGRVTRPLEDVEAEPPESTFEGMTGRGFRVETDGEETSLDAAFVFEDADAAAAAAIDAWVDRVESDHWYGAPVDEVTVSHNGAVVHAETTVPSANLWSE
jgi:hypothetical protein